MKKAQNSEVLSAPDAANTFVQKTELRALKRLTRHIQALEKQLESANRRAHGSGGRNAEGFRNRGCGCRTCVARVRRIQAKLDAANEKYQAELRRLSPYQNLPPNPDGTKLLTSGA